MRCDFFEMNAEQRCSMLPIGLDLSLYENTFDVKNDFERNQSSATTTSDTSTDTHSYASVLRRQHRPILSQFTKKGSSATACLLQNIYVNIPSTPPTARPTLRFSPIQQALTRINIDRMYENMNSSPVYINLPSHSKTAFIESSPQQTHVEHASSAKDTTQVCLFTFDVAFVWRVKSQVYLTLLDSRTRRSEHGP